MSPGPRKARTTSRPSSVTVETLTRPPSWITTRSELPPSWKIAWPRRKRRLTPRSWSEASWARSSVPRKPIAGSSAGQPAPDLAALTRPSLTLSVHFFTFAVWPMAWTASAAGARLSPEKLPNRNWRTRMATTEAKPAAPTENGDRLAEAMRGPVIRPEDPGYDEARKLFNGMIDRRPALIARCHDAADVIAAVNHARAEGLTLAIRGGGHNGAGLGSVDDGLVVDLSPMR